MRNGVEREDRERMRGRGWGRGGLGGKELKDQKRSIRPQLQPSNFHSVLILYGPVRFSGLPVSVQLESVAKISNLQCIDMLQYIEHSIN